MFYIFFVLHIAPW